MKASIRIEVILSTMSNALQTFFKSTVLLHMVGWMIFFVAPLLLAPPGEFESAFTNPGNLESLAIRNLLLMILFYFNYFYLAPVVLKKNGTGMFIVVLSIGVVLVSVANWRIHHTLSEPFGPGFGRPPMPEPFGRRPRPMMLASSLFASFLMTIIMVSISTSIILWRDWVKARVDEQERAFQKVASELAVLKLEISPHFLFNTLNNIRWLVRSKSDNAEEAVMKLSQLLRYILYQTQQDKTDLDKEIDNLRDYISLQQMRLTGGEKVHFTCHGETAGKKIVPLLFIPIAENFFKYGNFNGSFSNAISLDVEGQRLRLTTENAVLPPSEGTPDPDSGIGLSNVKRRLALHYPGHHLLSHSEKGGIFKLELEIILG
jgi:hypothetical protein